MNAAVTFLKNELVYYQTLSRPFLEEIKTSNNFASHVFLSSQELVYSYVVELIEDILSNAIDIHSLDQAKKAYEEEYGSLRDANLTTNFLSIRASFNPIQLNAYLIFIRILKEAIQQLEEAVVAS